jgi:hypothetical protein
MKPIDILLLLLVALLVILAVRRMIRRKKSGKCLGCGGNCASCIYHTSGAGGCGKAASDQKAGGRT